MLPWITNAESNMAETKNLPKVLKPKGRPSFSVREARKVIRELQRQRRKGQAKNGQERIG